MPATFLPMKDHAMDFALARVRMIESQLRPNGVTDERILQAIAAIPREFFVPAARRSVAYMDEDVQIGSNRLSQPRFLLEPMTLGRLLQLLDLEPDETVLDIGCGTGYSTAVLAHLAKTVVAVECDSELAGQAVENLAMLGLANTRVITGHLGAGCVAEAPFNAILVNGRIPGPPLELLAQLRDPGRLAAVVGQNEVGVKYVFDAGVACLPGFELARPAFEF
jgi:protein-L-isoaspartate(D-aspartate) O-methyltransferase